ncbi:MAG: DUF951 domain-containing protein [Clostridia bacterium]|nr:DUF951 domain-containing protein [Clostridia bacterium]
MKIIRFYKDDVLIMKKKHPCGSDRFLVKRAGSDVRIACMGCGRDTELPRLKLEKNIKAVISASEKNAEQNDMEGNGDGN